MLPSTNPFAAFDDQATGFSLPNAIALAWASDLAYLPDEVIRTVAAAWGFDVSIIDGARETRAIVLGNAQRVVIAYRGTVNGRNGCFDPTNLALDADAIQVPGEKLLGVGCMIHSGFAEGFASLRSEVMKAVCAMPHDGSSNWVTGHSLGGALAVLDAVFFLGCKGVYTFGQPKVGNGDFADQCDHLIKGKYFRIVHQDDIVPHVPGGPFQHYAHAGVEKWLDGKGNLRDGEAGWPYLLRLAGDVPELVMSHVFDAPIADHDLEAGYIKALMALNPQSQIRNPQ